MVVVLGDGGRVVVGPEGPLLPRHVVCTAALCSLAGPCIDFASSSALATLASRGHGVKSLFRALFYQIKLE
jgi:hypothetical protein